MRSPARFLIVIALLSGIGWWHLREEKRPPEQPDASAHLPTGKLVWNSVSASADPAQAVTSNLQQTPKIEAADPGAEHLGQKPPPLVLDPALPAWEGQIEAIEQQASLGKTARAAALLSLLPSLPEESWAETTERAVALLPNADYATVASPIIQSAKTHGRVMSVMFADLMERPDSVTLPALLRIARNPAHEFAPFARENLALILEADFGADWIEWESAINRALDPGMTPP